MFKVLSILLSAIALVSAEYICPTFQPAQFEALAMQCLEDPDGLCGDMCVGAITKSSADPSVANLKVPCTGGIDGFMENVLKKCTEEFGAPFDPCGGKTKKALMAVSKQINCEEGGVLADYK